MTGWDHLTVDLVDTASAMIDAAAIGVASRLNLSSPGAVAERLRRGDVLAISYFRLELSGQIATALLSMDPYVIAVYEEQDGLEPGQCAEGPAPEPLRLFVEVECETPALRMVIDALDEALSQTIDGLLPAPPRGYIEAIVVDDHNRRLLRPRTNAYRSAPILLLAREPKDGVAHS